MTVPRDSPPSVPRMAPSDRSAPGDRPPPDSTSSAPASTTASRRILDRPPSDRYRRPAAPEGSGSSGSLARAVGYGLVPAILGLTVFFVLAGPLAFSAGLIVVALALGSFVGIGVRMGGARTVPSATRRRLASVLTLAALVVAEFLTWRFALSEGGVLPFVDYLAETFGWLVPAEFVAGLAAAWLTAGR